MTLYLCVFYYIHKQLKGINNLINYYSIQNILRKERA